MSTGRDGYVVQLDKARGEIVRVIKAHDKTICSLAVWPDSRFVVTGRSNDPTSVCHIAAGGRIGKTFSRNRMS